MVTDSAITVEAKTQRSGLTLAAILDTALEMAASDGLESLTVGEVAKRLGLSKSGVFSRIGSREALQKAVVEEYDRRFLQDVFVPAMREPRGLPRLNAIMRLWLQRARDVEIRTGCLYCAGAFEYDDREGPLRELLLDGTRRWRAALRRTAIQAIEAGHLHLWQVQRGGGDQGARGDDSKRADRGRGRGCQQQWPPQWRLPPTKHCRPERNRGHASRPPPAAVADVDRAPWRFEIVAPIQPDETDARTKHAQTSQYQRCVLVGVGRRP